MGLALASGVPVQSNEVSMKAKLLVAVIALVVPQALRAQVVSAEIVIHQGPVAARVAVNPYYYPRYHVARVIVVERNHGHHRGWYKKPRHRIVAWYDPGADRYYDRYDDRRPGLREVYVYECDGRYFRESD
jgi:hypothetical protein